MTRSTSRFLAASTAVAALAGAAQAQLIISVVNNIGNELGGVTFNDGDMVQTDFAGTAASIFFAESNWTSDGDTDAFHILPNGNYLFSSLFNSTIGGVTFDDADLIEYNPNTGVANTYFITAASFDAANEDISGVSTLANGNIVFSTNTDASIGGVGFTDGDLVEYDITTDTVSILIPEAQIFDDGDGDIYGIHADTDGTFLLSAVADEMVSGTMFLDGDVFRYDPVTDTATLVFGESAFDGQNQDIDAIFLIPAPGSVALLGLAGLAGVRRRR